MDLQKKTVWFMAYSFDLKDALIEEGFLVTNHFYHFDDVINAVRNVIKKYCLFEPTNVSIISCNRKWEDLLRFRFCWDPELAQTVFDLHLQNNTTIGSSIIDLPTYNRHQVSAPQWYQPHEDQPAVIASRLKHRDNNSIIHLHPTILSIVHSLRGVSRDQTKFTVSRVVSLVRKWLVKTARANSGEVERDLRSPLIFSCLSLGSVLPSSTFHVAQLRYLLLLANKRYKRKIVFNC